jgi:hypothetical protein
MAVYKNDKSKLRKLMWREGLPTIQEQQTMNGFESLRAQISDPDKIHAVDKRMAFASWYQGYALMTRQIDDEGAGAVFGAAVFYDPRLNHAAHDKQWWQK